MWTITSMVLNGKKPPYFEVVIYFRSKFQGRLLNNFNGRLDLQWKGSLIGKQTFSYTNQAMAIN